MGAAHRLARHLARVRAHAQGESDPSPLAHQQALRDVISHCLYGVDVNPMAAELCRVSLWLEALEPGKPLSFLDHHIRVGNSLLGTTRELIVQGIPDEAFNPIEGDDKKICSGLKKRNKQEREGGQRDMLHLMAAESRAEYNSIESRIRDLDESPDDTIEEIRRKAEQFNRLVVSPEYRHAQLVADAWCAAFVWKKQKGHPDPITTDTLRRLEEDPKALTAEQAAEVERLSAQYRFFHWHLAFPEVFASSKSSNHSPFTIHHSLSPCGFDCVLSNPPWEHTELKEKEWFAERSPEIANSRTGAERKRMIEALKKEDPALYAAFSDDLRQHDGVSHFLGNSGRYPFCGRGRINLYAVFAEGMRSLLNERGRVGAVLPTGIATDDTTKFFFQDVVEKKSLASLYDFENKGIFEGVHSSYKFCLFTCRSPHSQFAIRRSPRPAGAEFAFFAHAVEDLSDSERRFTLSAEDIDLLNPNTRTCPIFRSRKDAELTKAIYRRVPVLIREARDGRPEENPWGIRFKQGLFNMTSDSHLFRTREQLEAEGWGLEGNIFKKEMRMANGEWRMEEYLPLYEAKMIHHFDHRWATYDGLDTRELTIEEKQDPNFFVLPRYWVRKTDVESALSTTGWTRQWLLGWRDITNTTNERTVIFSMMPPNGVGHTCPIMISNQEARQIALLTTSISIFAHDFIARQKVGGTHLTYGYLNQLPILLPSTYEHPIFWCGSEAIRHSPFTIRQFLLPRVLELTYTAWDLEPFARDCGWTGPPFRWDEERRFLLRCELDAAFFHLYLPAAANGEWRMANRADGAVRDETPEELGELKKHFPTPRDAVSYIMDTFPIVRRKDEEKYGEYRTKRVILEIYDEMAEAMRTGVPYKTRLDPPPGPPADKHGNFLPLPGWKPGQPKPPNWPPHIHPPRGC